MSFATNMRGTLSFLILASCIFLAKSALAQEEPPPIPKQDQAAKAAGTTGVLAPDVQSPSDPNGSVASTGPPNPYAGTFTDAGTGLPLFGTASPLRWGSFSVSTFEAIGIHDTLDGSPISISSDLAIFRIGLMFDHNLLRNSSRIVLQYFPQMAFTNGEFHANAAMNNDVSVGTTFRLTPRLSLMLKDTFIQTHSDPLIPQNYLAVDGKAGALVQNNFLDTNGSFIADEAIAIFEYDFSSRTNITFSPAYRYARSTNNLPNYEANGQTYTGVVTLGHRFTPRRTMGIVDSFQYLKTATASLSSQNATYNTIGGFLSQQLTRTLWVAGQVGAVSQSYTDAPNTKSWGANGGFSVIKNLSQRASMSVVYTRGITLSNYVTLQRSDRVDASIGLVLSSRLSWTNGFGYYRTLGGNPNTIGKYAVSDAQFRFVGNFNLFATYAYQFQNESTVQLVPGTRRTIAYGIRWLPPILAPR